MVSWSLTGSLFVYHCILSCHILVCLLQLVAQKLERGSSGVRCGSSKCAYAKLSRISNVTNCIYFVTSIRERLRQGHCFLHDVFVFAAKAMVVKIEEVSLYAMDLTVTLRQAKSSGLCKVWSLALEYPFLYFKANIFLGSQEWNDTYIAHAFLKSCYASH